VSRLVGTGGTDDETLPDPRTEAARVPRFDRQADPEPQGEDVDPHDFDDPDYVPGQLPKLPRPGPLGREPLPPRK
jgi:hypothetical protein